MADGIDVTQGGASAGVAEKVYTDQCLISGINYQVQGVKLAFGADGSFTLVATGNGLPVTDPGIGSIGDGIYSGSGNGSVVSLLKKIVDQNTSGITFTGNVGLNNAEGVKGQFGGMVVNPSVSFNRPANTTLYDANDLVANSTTAGSVSYPALTVARVSGGSFEIPRLRLMNNATSVAGLSFRVRLYAEATPTFGVGDGGTWAVTLGSTCRYLGSFTGIFEGFTDRCVAILNPEFGVPVCGKLTTGTTIQWDLQTLDPYTPTSGSSFTLIPEVKQD